jgi:hypothetical protein
MKPCRGKVGVSATPPTMGRRALYREQVEFTAWEMVVRQQQQEPVCLKGTV